MDGWAAPFTAIGIIASIVIATIVVIVVCGLIGEVWARTGHARLRLDQRNSALLDHNTKLSQENYDLRQQIIKMRQSVHDTRAQDDTNWVIGGGN